MHDNITAAQPSRYAPIPGHLFTELSRMASIIAYQREAAGMYRLANYRIWNNGDFPLARDAGEDCLVTLAQRVADRYYSLARRAAGVGDGREAWGKNHEPPFVDILNNLARQQALEAI